MADDFLDTSPPPPNHLYITTLVPHEETVAWKIPNVSSLLKSQAWTAVSIPMQVGLGATELSSWTVSLMARSNNRMLCARTMLLSPQEQHRRVTHHLKVAVVKGGDEDDEGPVYYFPAPSTTTNPTNSSNPTNASNSNNANLINVTTSSSGDGSSRNRNDNNTGCGSMRRALRRIFIKNAKLDGDDDELIGDGRITKEARPTHKAPLNLWKIMPIDKIQPGEDDSIELRVTMTVFGCDLEEKRV